MGASDGKDWAAERRAELVQRILRGESTVADVSRQHGLTPATIEDWKARFLLKGREALDIGARRRSRSPTGETFLADVGEVLSSSLDSRAMLEALARAVVPRLADWCMIDLVEGQVLRRAAVTHADPGNAAIARGMMAAAAVPPHSAFARVLETGEPMLTQDIEDASLDSMSRNDDHRRAILAMGLRSGIMAPMAVRGRVLGIFSLATAESGRRLGSTELDLVVEVARRAALAVENAALYRDTQEALRRSEESRALLDALRSNAPVGMSFVDLELRFVHINRQLAAINGLPPEQHIGRTIAEVVPGVAPFIVEQMRRVLESGQPVFDIEVVGEVPTRPGEQRNYMVSHYPVRTTGGEILGVGAVVSDVTDRKRAEAALAKERDFVSAIVDTVDSLVLVLDRHGYIVRFNRACEQATGFRLDEVKERPIWEMLLAPEDAAAAQAMFEQLLAGGRPETIECHWRTKRGARRLVAWSNTPLAGEKGAVDYVIGTGIDITDRKELEEQLRQSQKMEAIGRLAGGVAHDFNNILTTIIGYSELFLESMPDAHHRRQATLIWKAAMRGSGLTSQLLAFSRKQVLRPVVLDLGAVIPSLEKMLRPLIGENIDLRTSLESGTCLVRADRVQIEQVIMNLVLNARDAMPEGGRLSIRLSCTDLDQPLAGRHGHVPPGSYARMTVSDDGEGMDAETQARLFEPFFTTKELGKGTGLGLSTVYGIVKQSGGHISVDSAPGEGTSFAIYWPRLEGARSRRPRRLRAGGRCKGETVLVVEDEDDVRNTVQGVLANEGYAVLAARTGREALRLHARRAAPLDLLLTDVVMPGMSGPELATRMVAARPGVKTLFMSGYTGHLAAGEAHAPLLSKPFTRAALVRAVRAALESGQAKPRRSSRASNRMRTPRNGRGEATDSSAK